MAGTTERSRCRRRISQCLNSGSTVGSRDSGRTTVQFIYRNCKRSSQHRSVITYLMRQIQFLATRHCNRCTKHPTCVFQHEINFLRSYFFSSNNQISLIFAVFIIHYYDKLAFFKIGNCILYFIHFNLFHNNYLLIFCMMN